MTAAGSAPSVRVTRLKIQKFRAIASAEIELDGTVALVGQNGAGKSSVLRAINAFFNFDEERQDFESGVHAYKRGSQSVIEVRIEGLTEHPNLPISAGAVVARLKFRRAAIWEYQVGAKWLSVPQGFREALREQISFALIPTRRDHGVAHDEGSGILERAVHAWVEGNRQRDRTSPKLLTLAETLSKQSLSGLQRQLRKVARLDGPFEFELQYSRPPDYRLLLQNLHLTVREGGQSIPLSDSGSGTQSMAIFALHSYLAELQSTSYLLGFEEPEQNLHPQAQQQLMRNLRGLGLQVIFTTHSPTIVDTLEHEQVVLCKRTRSKQRDLEVRVTQISRSFFSDHGLDRDSYYKFHGRKNSEFLFADLVVVTEGPTDAAVVERLLLDAGHTPESLGMSIVALDGVKRNIDYMFHLLRGLGIDAAFVVDRDYFLPYSEGERKKSQDSKGFPKYASTLKPKSLLEVIVPRDGARAKLTKDLASRPTEAMKALLDHGIFCFMWALEVDLVNAATPRSRMYDQLNVPVGERSTSSLLIDRSGAIKRPEVLLPAIDGLPASALPTSYKSLRRELPLLAKAARGA